MEARAIQKRRRNSAADLVLGLSQESINERKRIAGSRGSGEALREILRQMGEDDDGDGIPNAIDFVDNRKAMKSNASDVELVRLREENARLKAANPTNGGNP